MEEKTLMCSLVLAVTLMLRRAVAERIRNDGRAVDTDRYLDAMFGRKKRRR